MKETIRSSTAQLRSVGMTLITAHSGCEGTAPNSLDHILAAIDSGAEMIEVDIRSLELVLPSEKGKDEW